MLVHGYPQTHAIWHKIASCLSQRYTVILADLRGYGDSSKPDGGPRHENYSFRAMAEDQVDVMGQMDTTPSSSERMTAEREWLVGCASTILTPCARFA